MMLSGVVGSMFAAAIIAAPHYPAESTFTNPAHVYRATGFASYYSKVFHGNVTASGKVYDENLMTAAHRSLPFGTLLRVTNLRNHRSVIVVVTDRGPATKKRIIDLSRESARKLGMLRQGIVPVRIQVINK